MQKKTPTAKMLLWSIRRKYNYFSKRNMLHHDGSFYYADWQFAEELETCEKSIKRAKILLQEHGEIQFIPGKHKGIASKFWVTGKHDKMSPFELNKHDKNSKEGDNFSQIGGQNAPPNKEITKHINKEIETQIIKDQFYLDTLIRHLGLKNVKEYIEKGIFILKENVSLENHNNANIETQP